MAETKTVFVTGGTGYIGSHCIVELLTAGYDVITVDNLANSRSGVLRRVQEITGKSVTFYQCDLVDGETIRKIFAKHHIHFVMHFAAHKNVAESFHRPFEYYKNNMISSINLIEVMQEYEVFEIVFSSSCSVYGDPDSVPIFETHPTGNATSIYGKTKFFTEQLLLDISKADKRWNIISLRYFNPIGAHPSGRMGEDNTKTYTNLLPIISQVASGKRNELVVYGSDYDTHDGSGIRDYIHIMDLVEGHVLALAKLRDNSYGFKAFNLGLGIGLSVLDLVSAFEVVCGKRVAYRVEGRREGDVAHLVCDASLATRDLGWSPKRNVKDMCEDFWRWQMMNPNGYSDELPMEAKDI